MNVIRELIPYDTGIPATEFFDLVWVYPERFGFPGDGSLEIVVSEGFEGVV